MQISSNINTMVQLENRLDESAQSVASTGSSVSAIENANENTIPQNIDLAKEMVNQIEIPIAYTANAEVISVQNDINRTVIDIKA